MANYLDKPETEKDKELCRAALKRVMELCFYSQSELALRIGVSRQAVQKMVKAGYIPSSSMNRVARAVGMNWYEIRPDLKEKAPS